MRGYVAFDLDGTLARYDHGQEADIGEPIPAMVAKVKEFLARGILVRIMTARASLRNPAVNAAIEDWCEKHIGYILPITCEKDFNMIQLYDDRAIAVEENTGRILGGNSRIF